MRINGDKSTLKVEPQEWIKRAGYQAGVQAVKEKLAALHALVEKIHSLPEEFVPAADEDECSDIFIALQKRLHTITPGNMAAVIRLDVDVTVALLRVKQVLGAGELSVAAETEKIKTKDEIKRLDSIILDLEKSIMQRKIDISKNEKELAYSANTLEKAHAMLRKNPKAESDVDYSKMKALMQSKSEKLTRNQEWLKKLQSTLEEVKHKRETIKATYPAGQLRR